MRTLSEIIDAAKAGSETTHEELLYALLAYSALLYFDNAALRKLAHEPSRFRTPQSEYEESFRRIKTALGKSPKDFVGWNNDPKNPDYQRFHKAAMRLADKVVADGQKASGESPRQTEREAIIAAAGDLAPVAAITGKSMVQHGNPNSQNIL